MKKQVLSPKGCFIHAGRVADRHTYIWNAEVAVVTYLGLVPPEPLVLASEDEVVKAFETVIRKNADCELSTEGDGKLSDVLDSMRTLTLHEKKTEVDSQAENSTSSASDEKAQMTDSEHAETVYTELLDTLPDRFEYEQNMLYSHFARYDYDEVRKAEGKHRKAMLRQLANLFDKTGKILSYYYTVPWLCKQTYPPALGETVTGQAAERWRFLPGIKKKAWLCAGLKLKKQLGDGDISGLETLQLDSLDPEVLRLHELSQEALRCHQEKDAAKRGTSWNADEESLIQSTAQPSRCISFPLRSSSCN